MNRLPPGIFLLSGMLGVDSYFTKRADPQTHFSTNTAFAHEPEEMTVLCLTAESPTPPLVRPARANFS